MTKLVPWALPYYVLTCCEAAQRRRKRSGGEASPVHQFGLVGGGECLDGHADGERPPESIKRVQAALGYALPESWRRGSGGMTPRYLLRCLGDSLPENLQHSPRE